IPLESSLSLDVFPNPSSGRTNFALNLNEDAKLDIRIYDLLGKEVMSKIIDETLPAGSHTIEVDASALSQGVYTYKMMVTGTQTSLLTGRLVINR
ncbi:MAG: T9SS type A sorting domain-containing protein, partial [Bacteroidota bacterium]